MARDARTMVGERYGWPGLAARTATTYADARREAAACRVAERPTAAGRHVVVSTGNLLAPEPAIP